jgi:hypothetical protein
MGMVVLVVIVKGMLDSGSVVSIWDWVGDDGVVDGVVTTELGG